MEPMFDEEEYLAMYDDYSVAMRACGIEPENFEQFKKGMDLSMTDMAGEFDDFAERFVEANA
jgi:hypothetical protein